jgi:MOSC domain-containing protein YiiM
VSGDSGIEVIERHSDRISVSEIARLHATGDDDLEGLRRAAQSSALIESWRETFRERIKRLGVSG